MHMFKVASNKSQFLISEISRLSTDLLICFFSYLNSHGGFMVPLVLFPFALKDKCKCWKPIWNATLRKILGYFLSDVGPG